MVVLLKKLKNKISVLFTKLKGEKNKMIHKLKNWTEYFEKVLDETKRFEVREKRDRKFNVGDILKLQEWNPDTGYTGREITTVITYILDNELFCKEGYVIIGLSDIIDLKEDLK